MENQAKPSPAVPPLPPRPTDARGRTPPPPPAAGRGRGFVRRRGRDSARQHRGGNTRTKRERRPVPKGTRGYRRPSLLAAGSPPNRAARGREGGWGWVDPAAPARQKRERGPGAWGACWHKLPQKYPKTGDSRAQLSRRQPVLCPPGRDPLPIPAGLRRRDRSRRVPGAPRHSPPPPRATSAVRRSPRLRTHRRLLPPPPPAHPAARPAAAASAAATGSRPPRGSQRRPAHGARPPPGGAGAWGTPAGGMVRSPQAGVAGAGRPKGRRNGGKADRRRRHGDTHGVGLGGGGARPTRRRGLAGAAPGDRRRRGRRGLFPIPKYQA